MRPGYPGGLSRHFLERSRGSTSPASGPECCTPDSLVAEHGLVRGVLGLTEPEPTRDPVWDAAIAALVAWRLQEDGLPVPEWVNQPARFVAVPSGLGVDPADPVPPPAEVPDAFAQRGVLVWRDTFASV